MSNISSRLQSLTDVIDIKYRQACICRVARHARVAHKYLLIDCIRGNWTRCRNCVRACRVKCIGAAVSCATRHRSDSSSYEIMQNASWLSNALMHFASRRVISWKSAAIIHWLRVSLRLNVINKQVHTWQSNLHL